MPTAREQIMQLIRGHIDVRVYDGILGLGYEIEIDPDLPDLLAAGFGNAAP